MENKNNKLKFVWKNFTDVIAPVVGLCGLGGIVVGVLVGFFNYLLGLLSKWSVQIYSLVREHMAFIPLLFIGLAALAVLMAYLHKWAPETRGSGIPQTEGVVRGVVRFKWLKLLIGTISGSIISFFAGLSLGAEGPSVQVGAAAAQGTSSLFKSKMAWQRYIISGGAGAGFAVAFNAPLSGLVFVLEECHRRFSPMLLLSTSISIIFAVSSYRLIGDATHLWETAHTYFHFDMFEAIRFTHIAILLAIGVVCGLFAVLFNYLLINSQRGSDKQEKAFPYWARLLIVFILTGILGLFLPQVNGGGHSLVEQIAHRQFDNTLTLVLLLVVKFIMILLIYNSGATGGLFIPMLAIGALLGGIIADVGIMLGMDEAYYISIVCIGMTTFFGASVRAPLTAIVLIVEITGYDARFLPPAIAIMTAFLVAELFGGKPLYDSMLDRLKKIFAKGKNIEQKDIDIVVHANAFIIDKRISDILWPTDSLVVKVQRGEEVIVPDGETIIKADDVLTIQVETSDENETAKYLEHLITG